MRAPPEAFAPSKSATSSVTSCLCQSAALQVRDQRRDRPWETEGGPRALRPASTCEHYTSRVEVSSCTAPPCQEHHGQGSSPHTGAGRPGSLDHAPAARGRPAPRRLHRHLPHGRRALAGRRPGVGLVGPHPLQQLRELRPPPPRRLGLQPRARVGRHAALGPAAGEEVRDDERGTVHVRLLGVDSGELALLAEGHALEHLRRGVLGRADAEGVGQAHAVLLEHFRVGAREALGEAEVGELEAAGAVAGQKNVGRLEVAVDDDRVEAVEMLEGAEDVEGPAKYLALKTECEDKKSRDYSELRNLNV